MARANTATLDGLVVGYGARDTLNPQSATVHTKGNLEREILFVIDSSNIAEFATGTAVPTTWGAIPDGAVVRSARAVVVEAFVGLTATTGLIDVGLKQLDGTAIDANGLIVGANGQFETVDATVEGAGALIDGPLVTPAGYPSADITGASPTAGELHVYVQYDMPMVDQDAPAVITGEI